MRVVFGFIALGLSAAGVRTGPLHFDCAGPVTQRMTAAAILARYGKDARRETIPGAEGQATKAVVLYPDDPARRLEVTFWDDAQTVVASVTAGPKATGWTGPLGLHAGSTLAEVIAANGHNFGLSGFGWDYGGYITNFWSGKLKTLAGGCAVQVRLGLPPGAKIPDALAGERDLASTMPAVKASGARIETLSIGWPLPAGVKASDGGGAD